MSLRTFLSVTLLLLWPCLVGRAHADSDGYYCIGRGYLAYQFGFAAPPVSPHRLHIMRLGDPEVIAEPIVVELPQFQIHGMICGERAIQLAAFDAMYTVALGPGLRPSGWSASPPREQVRFPPGQNLGAWSRPVDTLKVERVSLLKQPNGYEIILEIVPRAASEECVTEITTRVIEVDAIGQVIREWLIFDGKGQRECG